MRKYLTTGLFSAILGIVIGGAPADAALVSRGFLDEALENYATTTALDLKATQSDFTDLSDKIGTLPDGITVQGMYEGWTNENGMLANPGLKGMYEGWTDSSGNYRPGLYSLSKNDTLLQITYNTLLANLLIRGAEATTINGVDYTGFVYPLWKLSEGIDKIGTLPDGYTTVGAALTAIKGIAEDAKAAALAAIPDPKAEGSTGKFVLTVDIVGDNATYRWEKIDRGGETTTTE